MSTRAIAPIVGVQQTQVRRDLEVSHSGSPAAGVSSETPDPRPVAPTYPVTDVTGLEPEDVADMLAEDAEVEAQHAEDHTEWQERNHEPKPPVTGLDGKTYTRPAPRATPRRALVDTARDAGQELRKAVERLERIAADDRFARNKEEVAAHLRHHLDRAIEVCQDLNIRRSCTYPARPEWERPLTLRFRR